jgi:hypothetical protein
VNEPELAQLHRDVAAWEKQLTGFITEATALELQAQQKWDQVAAMEERIAKDMALIAELEA